MYLMKHITEEASNMLCKLLLTIRLLLDSKSSLSVIVPFVSDNQFASID